MSTKAKQKQWFLQKTFMPIFLTVHYVTMYITGFGWSTSDLLLPTCVGKETEAAITPKVPPNQLPTTTISVSTIQRPLISYSRLCQRQTALHFITQKNASVPVVHKQTQTLILQLHKIFSTQRITTRSIIHFYMDRFLLKSLSHTDLHRFSCIF